MSKIVIGKNPDARINELIGQATVDKSFETLTYASTLSVAFNALRPNKKITLTGNIAITNTGTVNGSCGVFDIFQDGTGGRTVTINGTAVLINPTASTPTLIGWFYDGSAYSFDSTYAQTVATYLQGLPGYSNSSGVVLAGNLTWVTVATNAAPVASSVAFTGTPTQGQTLTGTYSYSDAESNTEGTSLKQWYRSDNTSALNRTAISGATGTTYLLQAGDVGKYIQYAVTPLASTGTTTGTQVFSGYSAAIATASDGLTPLSYNVTGTGITTDGEGTVNIATAGNSNYAVATLKVTLGSILQFEVPSVFPDSVYLGIAENTTDNFADNLGQNFNFDSGNLRYKTTTLSVVSAGDLIRITCVTSPAGGTVYGLKAEISTNGGSSWTVLKDGNSNDVISGWYIKVGAFAYNGFKMYRLKGSGLIA